MLGTIEVQVKPSELHQTMIYRIIYNFSKNRYEPFKVIDGPWIPNSVRYYDTYWDAYKAATKMNHEEVKNAAK